MKLIFFILLFGGYTSVMAQSTGNVYYDGRGQRTTPAASYYYSTGKLQWRVSTGTVSLDSIAVFQDTVLSYYTATNNIRSRFFYNSKGVPHGPYVIFHENGAMKEKGVMAGGRKVSQVTGWHPNGKVSRILIYPKVSGSISKWWENDYGIMNYWDSSGTQLVKNGNGYCDCYLSASNTIREKGKVVDGIRDSVWLGYEGSTLVFRETYNNGAFQGGIRYYKGTEIPYKQFEEPLSYKGKKGMETMQWILQTSLRYPQYAKKHRVEGTVLVGFTVTPEGKPEDIRVLQPVDESLDKEAMRVVNELRKWIPATVRGEPVSTNIVLPIMFKI